MDIERTLKPARTFLSRWNGSWAQMWSLTSSHRTLGILIRRLNEEGNLYIACLDPSRITGPVEWPNCQIEVEAQISEGERYPVFVVRDHQVGFEVICSGIEVKENLKLY